MKVVVRTSAYDKWIKNLRDARAIALIYARIGRLAEGNPGDAAPIGAGCSELRIHHAPVIEKTIGHIARSKGMAQIARELHIDRAGLYTSFAEGGSPSLVTLIKVLDTLGFRLKMEKKSA